MITNQEKKGNDDYQQPYQKRFRLPPIVELAKTLCGDINTLGESSKKYVEDVEFMTAPIIGNFEAEKTLRDAVLNTLFAVVTEQPQKILHISGLVQVVNAKNSSIGKTIAEFFHQKAQELIEQSISEEAIPESFETGPWNRIKLILRFLSTLSTLIKESSLITLHIQFLKHSIALQANSPEKRNPLAEAIYYNTLTSVPYLLAFGEPTEDVKKGIDDILNVAEEFKYVVEEVTITRPFVIDSTTPYEAKNIIGLILPAVKDFLSDEYKKVFSLFPQLSVSLKHLLSESERFTLPQFSIPAVEAFKHIAGLDTGLGSVDGMWRTPRLTFEVYLPVFGFDTVPKSSDFIGLLFDDIVIDIVEALEFNRKEVARQIITLDLFFRDGVFAPPATSIDQLKEIHLKNEESETKESTWKTEDVAIKNILSLIFKLPTVSQPFAYFYTTLVEACTNAAQAIAPVLGRAIRFFYSNIHAADFELRFRYLDWLAVQLSNFNFTWKWREWEEDSLKNSKSDYHPRIAFIRNLISKELRLATKEKIQQTLTEEFHQYLDISLFETEEIKDFYVSLLGEDNLKDVSLSFEEEESKLFFLRENVSLKQDTEKLIEVFHKGSEKHYDEVIDAVKEKLQNFPNPDKLLITLVFQIIAFVGNRSISHAGKYIGNTFELLRKLLERESNTDKSKTDDTKDGETDEKMTDDTPTEQNVISTSEEKSLEKQLWAIDSILKYWNFSPQNGFLVLDVLESYDVLSSKALIKYSLDDSHKLNFGLINVSATESIFRLLTSAAFSGNSSEELGLVFEQLIKIIASTLQSIDNEGEIEVPDVEAEFEEKNEPIWKYHTAIGFLRAVLRKYSDEYVNLVPKLEETIVSSIKHEPTKDLLKKWFSELKSL